MDSRLVSSDIDVYSLRPRLIITGEYWLNVRERSFQFLEENDEDAAFVETEASKQRVLAREHTEKP